MIKWEKLKDIYYLSLFSYSRKRHILTCKVPELPHTQCSQIRKSTWFYWLFDIYREQARCFLGNMFY
jgi:hypothetical protein